MFLGLSWLARTVRRSHSRRHNLSVQSNTLDEHSVRGYNVVAKNKCVWVAHRWRINGRENDVGSSGDDDVEGYRQQKILNRLKQLQKEQQDLVRELESVGSDGEGPDLCNFGSPKVPWESVLRAELESMLQIDFATRNASEGTDNNGNKLVDDVECFAREVEESGGIPHRDYKHRPLPADEFLHRFEQSVMRFERLISGAASRKNRKHYEKVDNIEDELPWTQEDDDIIKPWHPFEDISTFPSDINEWIPSPDVPPEVDSELQRFQSYLYILRRALLSGKGKARYTDPFKLIRLLRDRKLLASDELVYEDPWVALNGIDEIETYLAKLSNGGVEVETDTIFGQIYEYRPSIRFRLVVLTYLHLPVPLWYKSYLGLHSQPPPPPDPIDGRPRWQPGQPISVELDKNSDLLPGVIYPRETRDNRTEEEINGKAHLKNLNASRFCRGRSCQVLVSNPVCSIIDRWSDVDRGICRSAPDVFGKIISMKPEVGIVEPVFVPERHRSSCLRTYTGKRNLLPKAADLLSEAGLNDDSSSAAHKGQWYMTSSETDRLLQDPLPRAGPADLENHPLTSEEAEYLLKKIIGDEKKFQSIMRQLPKKPKHNDPLGDRGMTWRTGSHMTVASSWVFDFSTPRGRSHKMQVQWSWLGGPFPNIRDAYDVWIQEINILESDDIEF